MTLYLIKYTPEIGTKKKQTRMRFIRRLTANLHDGLQSEFPEKEYKLTSDQNHILLHISADAEEFLQRIPGIKYFTKAKEADFDSEKELISLAYDYFFEKVKSSRSYAVRSRRTLSPQTSTRRIQNDLGAALNHLSTVNLSDPGVTCYVEVRGSTAYMFTDKTEAMHGLPVGVEGKTLTLLGGGFDSPVAAWKIYKTGMEQDFLYFDLDGQEKVKQSAYPIAALLKSRYGHGSRSKLIEINFMPVIAEIMKIKPSFRNMALKYCFYIVAERVCFIKRARALVTGESIGQVSTQTLSNLAALDSVIETMVIRPLITFTKDEIMNMARQIGTYDLAYKGEEYCALNASHVETATTKAKLQDALKDFDHTVLDKAIDNRKEIPATEAGQYINNDFRATISLPADRVIIDLRPKDQADNSPLPGAQLTPFDEAWNDFINWDPYKKYFLVCQAGSKSKILANFMEEQGFDVQHLEGGINKMR